MVSISFHDAGFIEVLDSLSQLTCMRFIVTEAVKEKNPAQIMIPETKPMMVSDAAAILVKALDRSGLELIHTRSKMFWRVVDKNRILLVSGAAKVLE